MREGYSVRQLSAISSRSKKVLKKVVSYWLKQNINMTSVQQSCKQAKYVLFDGTFFSKGCLLCVYDNIHNMPIWGEYVEKENAATVRKFLKKLRDDLEFVPKAITVDGSIVIHRVIKEIFPDAKIQRCLVHIQRQGLAWLRKYPKHTAAKELRLLLLDLTKISNRQDHQRFLSRFERWLNRFEATVDALPRNTWMNKNLWKTKNMLKNNLNEMFTYLSNPNIAPTNNKIESFYSRLKRHYRNHRGLREYNKEKYFKWYLFLQNTN